MSAVTVVHIKRIELRVNLRAFPRLNSSQIDELGNWCLYG